MMTFLKTILIILLVYYGLKFLLKLLLPFFMRYVAKKAGQRFEQAFGSNPYQHSPPKQEGDITVDKAPAPNTKKKSAVGEYVDYEEID